MTVTVTYRWASGDTYFLNDAITNGAQSYVALTWVGSGFFSAWWDGQSNGNVEGRLYSDGSTPAGGEFQLNSTATSYQYDPSLATLADGRIVLAFTDNSSASTGLDIRVRLFSAAGVPSGPDFVVSGTSARPQSQPHVAALTNGSFVVTYTDDYSSGTPGDLDTFFQLYSASGTLLTGRDLNVSTTVASTRASAAGLTGGNFVVAWTDAPLTNGSSGSQSLYFQRFASNGAAVDGSPRLIDNVGTINSDVQILGLQDGGFAVAYTDNGYGIDGTEITLQIFNSDGSARTSYIRVNTATTGNQDQPSLTQLADTGAIVVGWLDESIAEEYVSAYTPNGVLYAGSEIGLVGALTQGEITALAGSQLELVRASTVADAAGDGSVRGTPYTFYRYSVGDNSANTFTGDNILNDTMFGGSAGDTFYGLGGNDSITGGGGNDVIDGGAGVDTAAYSGSVASYYRSLNADGSLTIVDVRSGSPDGTDTLRNVERLQFSNRLLDTTHRAAADQDLDFTSDLLFRNANGTVGSWLSATAVGPGGYVGYGAVGGDWKIAGLGDFDGDGRADILWRNDSGAVGSWESSHGANNANYVAFGAAGSEWTVRGVLWASTKGAGAAGYLDVAAVSTDWRIEGAADIDGDGHVDTLWRNTATGAVGSWESSHGSGPSSYVSLGAAGSEWTVGAVADYDGDGKADILWRRSDGEVVLWASTKGAGSAGYLDVANVSTDWKIMGSGDFDGDGHVDTL